MLEGENGDPWRKIVKYVSYALNSYALKGTLEMSLSHYNLRS